MLVILLSESNRSKSVICSLNQYLSSVIKDSSIITNKSLALTAKANSPTAIVSKAVQPNTQACPLSKPQYRRMHYIVRQLIFTCIFRREGSVLGATST